jgi:hypothetical protein
MNYQFELKPNPSLQDVAFLAVAFLVFSLIIWESYLGCMAWGAALHGVIKKCVEAVIIWLQNSCHCLFALPGILRDLVSDIHTWYYHRRYERHDEQFDVELQQLVRRTNPLRKLELT